MLIYQSLQFTREFMQNTIGGEFTISERRRFLRAMELLDANEQHPSLRVHQLRGKMKGVWSASASDELRITFQRLEEGRKLLLACSRHYQ